MGIAERKEREKKQRRNEIISAAEAVFFTKGFTKATMDDIAKKAELSKGTLYLYFKSKEDLHLEVSRRGMILLRKETSIAAKQGDKALDKLRHMGWAAVAFAEKNPDYMQALLTMEEFQKEDISLNAGDVKDMLFKDSTVGTVLEVIELGIKDGQIRNDLPPVILAHTLWMSVLSSLRFVNKKASLLEFLDIDEKTVFNSHFEVILKGIRS